MKSELKLIAETIGSLTLIAMGISVPIALLINYPVIVVTLFLLFCLSCAVYRIYTWLKEPR